MSFGIASFGMEFHSWQDPPASTMRALGISFVVSNAKKGTTRSPE